ncbi:2189_t:CDS:1, partial [Ambispora leptoticha]
PPPPVDLNVTRSTLSLSRAIMETEGIKGFYRGYWLTLGVFVPQTVIYFVIYEKLKARGAKSDAEKVKRIEEFSNIQHYDKYGLPRKPAPKVHPHVALAFSSYFIYSAIASAIAASVSNVVDVIKTRWQVTYKKEENIKSPWQIIRNMYMHEGGIFAFGRGMIARVAWAVPQASLGMAVFEVLKELRRKRALELEAEANSVS